MLFENRFMASLRIGAMPTINTRQCELRMDYAPFPQRVSFFTSLWYKASLTVETALVLPVFMFAILSIMSLIGLMRYSNAVESGLHQAAREMAVKSYVLSSDSGMDMGVSGGVLSGVALSEAFVSVGVNNVLQDEGLERGNISYLRSRIMDKDIIDLIAVEDVKLDYDFLRLGSFRLLDRVRMHAFTGYDNTRIEGLSQEEEIVFITGEGEVYHKSRNCSHLKISVKPISSADIDAARNSGHGKYYPCEYCQKKAASKTFYITSYGDRYHTEIGCQALKRDVIAVPLSKAGGRRGCRDCAF